MEPIGVAVGIAVAVLVQWWLIRSAVLSAIEAADRRRQPLAAREADREARPLPGRGRRPGAGPPPWALVTQLSQVRDELPDDDRGLDLAPQRLKAGLCRAGRGGPGMSVEHKGTGIRFFAGGRENKSTAVQFKPAGSTFGSASRRRRQQRERGPVQPLAVSC